MFSFANSLCLYTDMARESIIYAHCVNMIKYILPVILSNTRTSSISQSTLNSPLLSKLAHNKDRHYKFKTNINKFVYIKKIRHEFMLDRSSNISGIYTMYCVKIRIADPIVHTLH